MAEKLRTTNNMADGNADIKENRFQLIGIRILERCDPNIRKVLKEGVTYFFVDGYEDDGENFIRKSSEKNDALEALYDIKGKDGRDIHVNISAIVGKNGCGKSTLLEVMLRILNNFAYKCGFQKNHQTLRSVNKPINACLYYKYGNVINTIHSDGENIYFYRGKKEQKELPKAGKSNEFYDLFYSIAINYSLYAYNENQFVSETKHEQIGDYQEKSWIAALFHKNDAYQTPVNITPMRTDGNIDINEENRLSRQRLMALYTYAGEKPDSRIINESTIDKYKGITDDNEIAIGFACTLDTELKLWTKCIDEYFVSNSTSYVGGFGFLGNLATTYDPEIWQDERRKDKIHKNIRGVKALIKYYKKNSCATKDLIDFLGTNNPKYKYQYAIKTDLKDLLSDLKTIHSYSYDNKSDVFGIGTIPSCPGFDWMTISQIVRMCTIYIIWNKLKKLKVIGDDANLEDDILDNLKDNTKDSYSAARLYLVYKIIHIIETYYSKRIKISEITETTIGTFPSYKSTIESIIKDLIDKDDYTTLKLHQTINYLKNTTLSYEDAYRQNSFLDKRGNKLLNKDKYLGFNDLKTIIESIKSIPRNNKGKIQLQEITKFLPPPILVGDIVIQHKGEYYGLSALSSGETQRLFTISSILYHLRNLDFKQTGKKKVQYKNISLVFDETEQYFHPEFQRTFVDYLLKQLNNASFEQINNINILLVTHSPFMLSDIPNNKILYLENGEKKELERLTFASNINDLLRHSFFLENGFMGEFAKDKTLDLINYLSEKEHKYNWDKDKTSQFIKLIGEPIIRTQLMKLFEKMQHETEDYEEWVTKEYMRIMEGKK